MHCVCSTITVKDTTTRSLRKQYLLFIETTMSHLHQFIFKPVNMSSVSTAIYLMCSKLSVKTATWPRSGVAVAKFEHSQHPSKLFLFTVNNRNTKKRCEICSKLITKTLERRHWHRSGVFIVNFEHIPHLFLVFLLLTLSMHLFAGIFISQIILILNMVICVAIKYSKIYWLENSRTFVGFVAHIQKFRSRNNFLKVCWLT